MRAWQTVKPGSPKDALQLNEDVEPPDPQPGTVLVKVSAAGIGLPDAFMCTGNYALTPSQFPFTQGQEVVGHVIGWGEGVQNRVVGDRVMAVTSFFTGNGAFAQECLALDDFCLPVPEGMADAEAAGFLIPFHTAHIALVTRGRLEAGETLVVIGGAGGTGQAALQIGKLLGARVIATAGGPEKAEFCRRLGADDVIDYRSTDIAEGVNELTAGRGADAIYDPVGGDAFTQATRCIANEGRILAIGFASGSWGASDTAHMVYNNYSVVGVIPSHYDRGFKERTQEQLIGWWKDGELRPQIDELVGFEQLPDALERLVGGGVTGKLALAVDPEATATR
ncbi:NADPH:quinone oxidoreductase family protein [Myxococcota bacterium]|nr:NADPH:quinone oxidoreductase family protein [Myxococcota bacterium]